MKAIVLEVDVAKLLVVEDDISVAKVLKEWLDALGHLVEHVTTGEDALQMLTNFKYEIILLDWELPGISGVDVCARFRKSGGQAYIMFTTGKGDIASKEEALGLGADDYLVKPYDLREVTLRINSLMRRPMILLSNDLTIDGVHLDPDLRVMTVGHKQVHLMPKEAKLLEYLMRHPNRPSGTQVLLDAVWPSDADASVDTIRTWMKNLRIKLAEVGKANLIKTIPRAGYLIECEA
ncbi:MAG TPA: response regulator transcription factor [Oculatellaceae cyanobacterium]